MPIWAYPASEGSPILINEGILNFCYHLINLEPFNIVFSFIFTPSYYTVFLSVKTAKKSTQPTSYDENHNKDLSDSSPSIPLDSKYIDV